MAGLRPVGIAALLIGYSLLAHYTNSSAHDLGALVSIAPLIAIALALTWNSPRRTLMLSVLAPAGIALIAEWPMLEQHFGLVYWLQDVTMLLVLFITFARTLFYGRQPLCTRFAEALHPPLSAQHEIYSRNVTIAWSVFFAVMALISTLLFFLAPLTTWSVFANFLTLPLIAAMFIAEYRLRRWMLPEVENTHILDALRAFRNIQPPPRKYQR
ncbi:MAG: hypothetical protein WC216_09715 [Gallionella sp.]|jgi:uncharacterized membrane protein